MSTVDPVPKPALPSTVAMIRTLGGIAMISGFLVVLVYQFTLPIINENKRRALEQAVFKVIPNAQKQLYFLLTPGALTRLEEEDIADANLFAGYDTLGKFAGVALEAAAPGYQDIVRTLYGYSPKCECIVGITVLESKETPGLGDKVETDPNFLANFEALDARLNDDKSAMLHNIETVKHGTKTQPWQIDAISGATITSKAIGRGLDESTRNTLPLLVRHLDQLEGKD
jgi:electron transport complex protein RnfG